jgi:NTP pyrophosphatase (non-canonical NTP hydrolase)
MLKSPTQEVLDYHQQQQINRLLDKLQEECAEIIQAVSKIRRFGPHNHHPQRNTSNHQELLGEIEDLQAILVKLESCGWYDPQLQHANITQKSQGL